MPTQQTTYPSNIVISKVPDFATWVAAYNNGIGEDDIIVIPPSELQPALPLQSGNSGKFLTTNGSVLSWAAVDAFPSQSGNSGKFLTTNGSAVSWATVDALPTQTSNAGKFLTTNGSTASWAEVFPSGGTTGQYLRKTANGVEWADLYLIPANGQSF